MTARFARQTERSGGAGKKGSRIFNYSPPEKQTKNSPGFKKTQRGEDNQ